MARDLFGARTYTPTPLTDERDPPSGTHFLEAVKDAFVERLRVFLAKASLTPGRRSEAPTVRKYASQFGDNEDPYATWARLVQEFPDLAERLPHIAVTAAGGAEKALSVGRAIVGTVQEAPRIVTGAVAPFALPLARAEVRALTVTAGPGTYLVLLNGFPVSATTTAGGVVEAAAELARELRDAAGVAFAVVAGGADVVITASEAGVPFTLAVAAGSVTASLVAAAGVVEDGVLGLAITSRGVSYRSNVVLQARNFPTAAPITAATAAGLARALNDQALYLSAEAAEGGACELRVGGTLEAGLASITVVPAESGTDIAVALGLALTGDAEGYALALVDGGATLTADARTPFEDVVAGARLTLSGFASSVEGPFEVAAVVGAGAAIRVLDPDGAIVAETAPSDAAWFVGAHDDWHNPLRLVKHRYAGPRMSLTVTIEVMCEDATTRAELLDVLVNAQGFFEESTFFEWFGRSVFDEAVPDEWMQLTLGRQLQVGDGSDFARPGGDEKDRVYSTRLSLPLVATKYRDREATIASGPRAGESWVLTADDVTQDDALAARS